jgi:hypothetical protein
MDVLADAKLHSVVGNQSRLIVLLPCAHRSPEFARLR